MQWLVAAAVASVAIPAIAAPETYVIDPSHSQPRWEIRHLGYTTQSGSFGNAKGKIVMDRAARTAALDVTIDATSVRSWNDRLDAILKGDKFFNVEKFPTITFKSSKANFENEKIATIEGDLTMVGVTKPVTLNVTSFACGENPANKKAMCGADASAMIKRSEFGMTSSMNSSSDEVKLSFSVEA